MRRKLAALLLLTFSVCAVAQSQTASVSSSTNRASNALSPITLRVDASEAARKILHTHMTMPVAAGPLTLFYPKWIPGEHGPTGPIINLAGLKLTASGRSISWQRDLVEMYAIHCDVPQGARELDVDFDFLLSSNTEGFTSAASASAQLVVINWNQLLLYPQGQTSDSLTYTASLRLPAGWKFGTALPVARESGETITFKPVTLSTLVDSPIIAGIHFRVVPLTTGAPPTHEIDLVSDSEAALDMSPEMVAEYKQLVAETGALFGARHYTKYHFLFTLSDYVASFGLEHHESSDDRVPERSLLDENLRRNAEDLLPHEFVHSWNGKYRRPADLTTPDFEQPMRTDLLWVYEGLTQYLGEILTARSGLWTPEEFREYTAQTAAYLDNREGRRWRPLADTANAAQLLYNAPGEWENLRRGVDFYDESFLIWLEADSIIRQKTGGRRSLDDFCRRFHGGESGPPKVVTYTFDDVVATMNEVAPYDWRGFFNERINAINPRAPLGGITNDGWKLVYTDTPNIYLQSREQSRKFADLSYSLGLLVSDEGKITDVLPGMTGAQAGLGPGMKIVAINGRNFSPDILREAVAASKNNSERIELLVESGEIYRTYQLNYHGGARYPHLVRDTGKPDMLEQVIKALAPRVR